VELGEYAAMKINDITLTEQQLDELGWKDIQRGAKKVAKGAEKFTKNVNDTGNALGGAANAIGGAAKAVGNQFVAKPVAGAYNAVKGGIQGASNVVKNVATDVGTGVAKAVGGTAGAVGAVAGGATTGVGRAAAGGFNTGAQAVGGDAKDPLASVFKQPGDTAQAPHATAQGQAQGASQAQGQAAGADVATIQSQIKQKQDEIQDLQTQLSQATTAARSATNTKTTQTKTTKQEPEDEENGIAKGIKAVDQAWQKGARPLGGAWGSVADTGKPEQKGIEGYTKTTDGQWLDKETNQPVADKKLLKVLNQQDKANAQAPQPAATTKQDTTAQATQAPAATPAPTAAPAPVSQKPAADELGRVEPTMEPATAQAPAAAKPAASYAQQGSVQPSSVKYNQPTGIPNTRIPQPMNAMTPAAAPTATTKKPAATVNASKINKSKGVDLAEALWKTIK
jgi:hypothetical protein